MREAAPDYGPYPDDYRQLVEELYRKRERSPRELRLRFTGTPYKAATAQTDGGIVYHWTVEFDLDQVKSSGRRSQQRRYAAIKHGQVIETGEIQP